MNPDSTLAVTNTCPKDGVHLSMPYTIITLTPAQAQRLINTYCYVTEPDAVERLTRSALSLYHTPGGNLVEFECDVYGEPVSWLSLDEINARVYGG